MELSAERGNKNAQYNYIEKLKVSIMQVQTHSACLHHYYAIHKVH